MIIQPHELRKLFTILIIPFGVIDSQPERTCANELPSDFKCGGDERQCDTWSGRNMCNAPWKANSQCVDTPIGKVKDNCKLSCGICGKY